MLRNRYAVWTTLWELFGTIDRRDAVNEKWDSLHELIEILREDGKAEWMEISTTLQAMDKRKVATPEQWDQLYNLLNKLWQEERKNNATSEELAAHAGVLNKRVQ